MHKFNNFTYDEISIGQSATLSKVITNNDIQCFAALSGDINPAHLDPEYAATTPFKKIIAHGMLSGALISTILGTKLPGPGTIYLSQNLKFIKPVYCGDTINISITVIEKLAPNRLILDCKCLNQNNEVIAVGEAKVVAPDKKLNLVSKSLPTVSLTNLSV